MQFNSFFRDFKIEKISLDNIEKKEIENEK